jgi:Flp pilus assembly protein TadG
MSMSRFSHRSRGAAAVEFALCLPFVVTLLAGLIDGGMHLATMHLVSRAARDGARIGSTTNEPFPADGSLIIANATATATSSMTGAGFSPGHFTVTATWPQDADGLRWVNVVVTGSQPPMFGSLSPFGGTLTQRFTMVTQEQP